MMAPGTAHLKTPIELSEVALAGRSVSPSHGHRLSKVIACSRRLG